MKVWGYICLLGLGARRDFIPAAYKTGKSLVFPKRSEQRLDIITADDIFGRGVSGKMNRRGYPLGIIDFTGEEMVHVGR